MIKILTLAIGGAFGTLSRYYISELVNSANSHQIPFGTIAVNLIGSFVIGALWALLEGFQIGENYRIFLFTGILGGFTTFSAFALETMNLMNQGSVKYAIYNVLITNVTGLLLVALGYYSIKYLLKVFTNQ